MPPTLEHLEKIRRLNFLLRFGFFATGIATVLIGQVLPILAARLRVNDLEAGDFFIFQFAGSLLGTAVSNWFGRRNKYLPAAYLGCFLIAGGVLFLNFDSFALCLAGFFLNGLGIGLTLPAMNMLTLELNPPAAGGGGAAALNILNFFWGVGAILSQPFVDLLRRGTGLFFPTAMLAAVLVAVGVVLFLTPREMEHNIHFAGGKTDEDPAPAAAEESPIWTRPLAWLIALFNFIHVGFESGMGGWLKTYTGRVDTGAGGALFPPILLYFCFFVAGRAAAPVFLRRLDENRLLMLNLLVMLAGTSILLFAENIFLLSVGASVAGFGTSSVFPTNVSRFANTFGASATRRATPLFLCGTLGAAITTWVIGFASNYFGDLRSGMFVLLGGSALLVVLQIFLMLGRRQSATVDAAGKP